jgi:hypothetical protein
MPDPVKKTVVKRKNRVTAVKNADGTTTKTRVRRDGTTKKVKTYKGKKTVASKVVKYRKDGSKKRSLTRPGDKTGTIVRDFNSKGKQSGPARNRKKVVKKTVKGIAVAAARTAGSVAAMSALSPIMPAIAGVTAAGIAANELKKARPIKAMQNAAKWIKKGVKNKIQTGNRKGITKKKK